MQDRIANHFDATVAAIYDVHSYDEEARAWLQRWVDYLDGAASTTDANVVPLLAVVGGPE